MDGLLCSAKLGVRCLSRPARRRRGAGGVTPAFFVVRGSRGSTLLNSASAALSLRWPGRGDGSSGTVTRPTHLLPAPRALCGEQALRLVSYMPLATAASAAIVAIARQHSWCTSQEKASLD